MFNSVNIWTPASMPNPTCILTRKEVSMNVGDVQVLSRRDGAEERGSSVHSLSESHPHLDTHSEWSMVLTLSRCRYCQPCQCPPRKNRQDHMGQPRMSRDTSNLYTLLLHLYLYISVSLTGWLKICFLKPNPDAHQKHTPQHFTND